MFSSVFPLSLKNFEMSKTYFVYCIMKVEGVGSSKSAANQNETNVIQLNDRGKEDEQTLCSKLVGKDQLRRVFLNWRLMSWTATNLQQNMSSWNVWRLSLKIKRSVMFQSVSYIIFKNCLDVMGFVLFAIVLSYLSTICSCSFKRLLWCMTFCIRTLFNFEWYPYFSLNLNDFVKYSIPL